MKSKSLYNLLETVNEFEEGLVSLTDNDIGELIGDVKGKVDGIREVLTRMESEENRLAQDIKELQARKRSFANSRRRLKQYVVNSMVSSNTQALCGNRWDVKIQARKIHNIMPDCNASHYENLGPKLVRRTFEFDTKAVVDAYKKNPEAFGNIVVESKSEFIRFSAHKGEMI